jgi:hypothetical protein
MRISIPLIACPMKMKPSVSRTNAITVSTDGARFRKKKSPAIWADTIAKKIENRLDTASFALKLSARISASLVVSP